MATQPEVKQTTTSTCVVPPSSRLRSLPTYAFAELDELKEAARKRDAQLIDLGMGNPDQPTPQAIIDIITNAVNDKGNHGYPNFKGKPEFRQAVAGWMQRRYGVFVDWETEIQALIGSKEGLAHLSFAYTDDDSISLVPTPYYPVHARASWLAGGEVYILPLTAENNFLPDLDSIPAEVARRARLLFLSYPNNPTTAVADLAFYEKAIAFCKQHEIIAVSDLAYGEIAFDGYQPPSILQVPGAKDIAIEFHSFSKSFNMAGWRIGFAVGNAAIVKNLFAIKTNLDYGVSSAIQDGAIHALNHAEKYLPAIVQTYQERRDLLVNGFRELGWPTAPAKASMYVWLPVPKGFTSATWCRHLIDQADVVITPGSAFGDGGEGYFRVSLVSPKEILQEALDRLKEKGIRYEA